MGISFLYSIFLLLLFNLTTSFVILWNDICAKWHWLPEDKKITGTVSGISHDKIFKLFDMFFTNSPINISITGEICQNTYLMNYYQLSINGYLFTKNQILPEFHNDLFGYCGQEPGYFPKIPLSICLGGENNNIVTFPLREHFDEQNFRHCALWVETRSLVYSMRTTSIHFGAPINGWAKLEFAGQLCHDGVHVQWNSVQTVYKAQGQLFSERIDWNYSFYRKYSQNSTKIKEYFGYCSIPSTLFPTLPLIACPCLSTTSVTTNSSQSINIHYTMNNNNSFYWLSQETEISPSLLSFEGTVCDDYYHIKWNQLFYQSDNNQWKFLYIDDKQRLFILGSCLQSSIIYPYLPHFICPRSYDDHWKISIKSQYTLHPECPSFSSELYYIKYIVNSSHPSLCAFPEPRGSAIEYGGVICSYRKKSFIHWRRLKTLDINPNITFDPDHCSWSLSNEDLDSSDLKILHYRRILFGFCGIPPLLFPQLPTFMCDDPFLSRMNKFKFDILK